MEEVRELLALDGSNPTRVFVIRDEREGDATKTFTICLDYEWAEKPLGRGGLFEREANALCLALAFALDCEAVPYGPELAQQPPQR